MGHVSDPPNVAAAEPQSEEKPKSSGLEDLLDNSMEGVIVTGEEESFDFDPPTAMSAHAAATGFDAEFTETVVIDKAKPVAEEKV